MRPATMTMSTVIMTVATVTLILDHGRGLTVGSMSWPRLGRGGCQPWSWVPGPVSWPLRGRELGPGALVLAWVPGYMVAWAMVACASTWRHGDALTGMLGPRGMGSW